ncbi:hypothetical protein BIV57_19870 [Mangrovactinospora gilvigrisea]|uniref:Peptidase M3A/M3B catalytic domain-containing protein n=1 Tax=Mangrovactinospora gilvigrisea TaxID=1428644 RepID=A0A1J7BQL3_9ACTN|nr:M3 family metallopeptidase [Mangrovactinospora gilvigrisea]OIV35737.1 hypothetical protein BIV57_19870 [Mangrovactinospora gilvigrisea]
MTETPHNPLIAPSTLPYALPPFADIRTEHYLPAIEHGMAEQLREIGAITADPAPADFANTLEALERSGTVLANALQVFFLKAGADTDEAIQAVEAEIAPRLAAHGDAIHLDPRLWARIKAVPGTGLDAEQTRLLERYRTDFARAGADLTEQQRDRLRALNTELAAESTRFEQDLFADTRARALVVEDRAALAGLPDTEIEAAAENARALGRPDGSYVLSLKNFSNQPQLARLENRETRRRLMEASLGRGLPGSAETIRRLAVLRAERAALLGYPSHAAYEVADQTARTADAVESMLARLVPPAVANARREEAALTAALRDDLGDPEAVLEPWDWAYYAEKVRRVEHDVDDSAVRSYLELERVIKDGVFHAAHLLYGLTFTERPDLVGYHPEVRAFEVFDADGSPLGLFLGDWFTRDSKRGGAWMNDLVPQNRLLGRRPVVTNNLNIAKPAPGEPALLTFDEVRTCFHEFGHALHGLFSDVDHPRLAGTEVPRDFVEYPSQVNEMWQTWPEVLAHYAVHHETGEPMPEGLVDRILAAEAFGEGFRTVEYLGAALLDWAWHSLTEGQDPGDVAEFEAAALAKAGIAMDAIPPRYRTGYFAHIWSHGYSAGYYSYIWSEVLDADTVEWFKESGGLKRANGDVFRAKLLSRGGAVDPLEAFASFRGSAPRIEPLLRRRGLAAE